MLMNGCSPTCKKDTISSVGKNTPKPHHPLASTCK